MNWTDFRVTLYGLIGPACILLAALFPGYIMYNADSQQIIISLTVTEAVGAVTVAGGIIAGVYRKFGKR